MTYAVVLAAALVAVAPVAPTTPAVEVEPHLVAAPSIYALDGTLRDQDGRAVTLASLRGSPVVIAMIYAECRAMCPLTIADMKTIERRLDEAARAHVRFVLVSFDPARDTPAVLKKRAAAEGFDEKRWTLLTGSDDDVRELAAVLGMKYRAVGAEFVHASIITVLDRDGVIRAQQLGTGRDTEASVAVLEALAR